MGNASLDHVCILAQFPETVAIPPDRKKLQRRIWSWLAMFGIGIFVAVLGEIPLQRYCGFGFALLSAPIAILHIWILWSGVPLISLTRDVVRVLTLGPFGLFVLTPISWRDVHLIDVVGYSASEQLMFIFTTILLSVGFACDATAADDSTFVTLHRQGKRSLSSLRVPRLQSGGNEALAALLLAWRERALAVGDAPVASDPAHP